MKKDNKNKTSRKKIVKQKTKEALSALEELVEVTGNSFDRQLADSFKDFVVHLADNDFQDVKMVRPTFTEKTEFGGDLSTNGYIGSSRFRAVQGVTNPEQIPYFVMERMMKDPQIAIGMTILTQPIVSLNFIINCKDERTKLLVDHSLRKVWKQFVKETLYGIGYGFSTFEKVFMWDHVRITDENNEGDIEEVFNDMIINYRKLKNIHPSTIKIDLDKKENYKGFIQTQKNGKEVFIPKRKSALFTYNFKFGNYYGQSLLRNVYKYWYWGELLYQFMLRYYESTGTPPVLVVVPKGMSQDKNGRKVNNLEIGLDMGRALISNSVAVLPYEPHKATEENMWSVTRLTDDRRGAMFVDAITHINTQKLLAMFVPENVATQEVRERDVFFFTQEGLINDLEDFVNHQVIPPLQHYNVPADEIVPCTIKLDKMSYTKKAMLKELYVEFIRSLRVLQREGIKPNFVPDVIEMSDQLEIPLISYDEAFDGSGFDPDANIQETDADVESDFDFETDKEMPTKGRGRAKEDGDNEE